MPITSTIFTNAASVDLKLLKKSSIFFKMPLLKAATERIGHSAKSYGVLFGTTEFMQRQCIEWLQRHSVQRIYKIHFVLSGSERCQK